MTNDPSAKSDLLKPITRCGYCRGSVIPSQSICSGITCYACRSCRAWWVPGLKDPIRVGENLSKGNIADEIRLRLGNTQQDKASQDEAMTAEFNDPRWSSAEELSL